MGALTLVAPAACGADEPAVPAGPLRIATGNRGGVYYTYGGAIATVVEDQVPALRPSVLVTAASAENLQKVSDGSAELGFTQADTAAEAAAGGARVAALARLYDDYLHLVVRAESRVGTLADLRRARVSIGAQGSGTVVTVGRLLSVAGLDPDKDMSARRLGLDDSAAALRAGTIDAFFFSGGLPVVGVQQLARQLPLRLVDIARYAADLRKLHGQFYLEHAVPASTYQLPSVGTIGIPNYLVVSAGMPVVTGYALTRAVFTGRPRLARAHPVAERLNAREAINTYPLELHPGAVRWYRENKP